MIARPAAPVALLFVAIVAGTVADRPSPAPPLTLGGYRVPPLRCSLRAIMASTPEFNCNKTPLMAY
jgi:hypothetical protein